MKQTFMWLALALLFAIGVDPLGHRLLIRACGHGRDDRARNLGGGATSRRRGECETGRAGGPRCDARRRAARSSTPSPASEMKHLLAGSSLPAHRRRRGWPRPGPALATCSSNDHHLAGQPGQDAKADIKPPEGDARPTRKPKDSKAELPAKRRTANARACGSPGLFSDLLRRLNLTSRCSTRRSAA